jgi:hypothetical protein
MEYQGTGAYGTNDWCLTGTSGGSGLGWPNTGTSTATLTAGASYTFSYTVQRMAGTVTTIDAKVGSNVSPYTADFENTMDAVTATATTNTHTWTEMAAGDTTTGVAFVLTGTSADQVCISNVSLTKN